MADTDTTWKDWFVNNWPLKVFAVVMGVLTFHAIRGTTSFEVPYDVPVEVKVEKGIAILDQNPRIVEVIFRGSQDDLRQLTHSQIKVSVKAKASDPAGSEQISLGPGNVEKPAGVVVVGIKPKNIMLAFDRETEKKVSIAKPKIIGKPLMGRAEIEYEPRTAIIRGPKRRLQDKNVLDTEPVDVDGRVESFSKKLRILPPGDAPALKIDPTEIEAKVNIVTESISRQWESVPVIAMFKGENISEVEIVPDVVSVTLNGRSELVGRVGERDILAFVDCSNLAGTHTNVPVNVFLPPGTELGATVLPETVKIVMRSGEVEGP